MFHFDVVLFILFIAALRWVVGRVVNILHPVVFTVLVFLAVDVRVVLRFVFTISAVSIR